MSHPSPGRQDSKEGPPLPDTLTSVLIDGNSLIVASGRREGHFLHLLAIEHLELDTLFETVRRLRHPIFMEVYVSWFSDKSMLESTLHRLLERPAFHHPVIPVLAAEKGIYSFAEGPADRESVLSRRESLIHSSFSPNPFDYPSLIQLDEVPQDNGHSMTALLMARLSDVAQLYELLKDQGLAMPGVVAGKQAGQRFLAAFPPAGENYIDLLCDAGKLRTLYVSRLPTGRFVHHAIPVGLARDDMNYFESLVPMLEKLQTQSRALGSLLLPPDHLPSRVPSEWPSSPQVDATRFAMQISRYAKRALAGARGELPGGKAAACGKALLTGRAARLPHLLPYVRECSGIPFQDVEGVGVPPRIRFGASITPEDIMDAALPIGALLATLFPRRTTARPLSTDPVPLPLRRSRCSVSDLQDGQLYVLEQKIP